MLLEGMKRTTETAAEAFKGLSSRIRSNRRLCWFIGLMGKYLLCGMVLLAWTIAAERYGQKQALETYRGWLEDYKIEQEEAAIAAYETDPYTIQLRQEAESLARVLYGVKDNSTDDLKTYCWCVFNRVDITWPT